MLGSTFDKIIISHSPTSGTEQKIYIGTVASDGAETSSGLTWVTFDYYEEAGTYFVNVTISDVQCDMDGQFLIDITKNGEESTSAGALKVLSMYGTHLWKENDTQCIFRSTMHFIIMQSASNI